MNDTIASTEFIAVDPAGFQQTVTIEVGKPYRADKNEYACPISMKGLHDDPSPIQGALDELSPIRGGDSFQALALALGLIRHQLRVYHNIMGYRFILPGSPCDPEFFFRPDEIWFQQLGDQQPEK